MTKYTAEDIKRISDNVSLIDYFYHLESKKIVRFDKKVNENYYFKTDSDKYSVSDQGFYNLTQKKGGRIIKAVMELEKKSWKSSVNFLKDFGNTTLNTELKKEFTEKRNETNHKSEIKVIRSTVPNNKKLLSFFENIGISKQVLEENTQQVHYGVNGKEYFGIGLKNQSNGYDIRNPFMKSKIGKNDFSLIQGKEKNRMVVFSEITNALSFLQLLKKNNKENNYLLVCLNSTKNIDKFIEKNKDYNGSIRLILDGNTAGDNATKKLLTAFKDKNIEDARHFYNINETNNSNLNNYLIKKYINNENTTNTTQTRGVSNSEQLGTGSSKREVRPVSSTSQSKQRDRTDNRRRQDLFSENAGNGLRSREELSTRRGMGRAGTSITGRIVGTREGTETLGGTREARSSSLENSTNISELDNLIEKYKGQKLTNEQVTELVSVACFVDENKVVQLNPKLTITDELKDLISQYKTGGIAKQGRGVLDEYYTNIDIVNSVKNLINEELKVKKSLSILEPSVGIGNFINAVKDLPNSTINTFEINETTAKISKILYPNIDVNLRSFETEFIDDKGGKKEFETKYDLVIGNPPYGDHRGFYKGLGEEPKISKYEDYFVKRSLDTMKEDGVLAMVLPSSWLNRQKKLNNAELVNAYRLPVGAFAGTQIGTDIVLLKKDSQKQNIDISKYFEENPSNVLGEIRERTNRFGKLEEYVHGNLDDALAIINNQSELQSEYKETTMPMWDKKTDTVVDVIPPKIAKNRLEKTVKENREPTLFDSIEEVNNNIAEKEENNLINKKEVLEKTKIALNLLNQIKFKTPAIIKEIDKYETLTQQLDFKENTYTQKQLEDIATKSNRIIDSYKNKKKNIEYEIQTKPQIKKGILKYFFSKNDNIINTSLQNNPNLTKEQVEAFEDTEYDGTLNNRGKHYKFANYIAGKWVHDFYYAERNIYTKLEQLERDKENLDKPQYEKQKELLKSVLPKPKKLEEIIISPNHEFVHKFDLGEKEVEKQREVYNQYGVRSWEKYTEIQQYTLADNFKDFVENLPSDVFQGSSQWEVCNFVDNKTVTGSDKERNALVRERRKEVANTLFAKFIKEEMTVDEKERFVYDFNRNYNNIHIPDYSQFPLFSKIHQNFKGSPLQLTEVQKAGVGRLTTKGVGLLAHEVGFGKTLSGILSMHEAMERGNAKRPLIAVPNDSILKQWVETIYEVIPNAKINILGNLGKSYDLSNFENKDNEITLVTYAGFNNIGFSKEVTDHLASKFSYISENELKSIKNSERNIQKEIEKENELKGKMKKGKIYDWEDFGFDHLTFDEVHNANHIVGKVRIEDRRFASDFRSQNQRTSALGINTWMASQYIQEKYDGRNVTLLSATPFTNKPLEYYSILSLVANNRLEEKGYFNVNTFFETFMEADNEMEIDAVGDVKYKSNVKRFKNNSIFQQLLGEFIDIKGEEDNPELVRPNRINKEYKIKQNDLTETEYEKLNDNFAEDDKGAVLTHILNARLIAISPYLSLFYDNNKPTIKEFVEKSPKLKTTMDLIAQNKKDQANAGQIIYSELAVDEFPKIKEYLIKEIGFEDKEVAIIIGKTSKTQRQKIQEDFNEGKIKVVIGSSAIQEGMNLQENTSDMYLLSLPYNFTSLRQTEGRAWRQGNKFENVRINYMLTEDSIDVFMLQKLQDKQARYIEAMKKDVNILDISDISTSELKTALITNPITRAEIEVQIEKKRLENEKSRLIADSSFILRKFEDVTKVQEEISLVKKDIERYQRWAEEGGVNEKYYKEQVENKREILRDVQQEMLEVVSKLNKKGIDVDAIKDNIKLTEEKVAVIEKQIEDLSIFKDKLTRQYQKEKEEKDKLDAKIDWVQERMHENKSFYKLREEKQEEKNENNMKGFKR